MIVSNDLANEISNRVIVAPITSSVKNVYPFEVGIELFNPCKILLDQVRSLDKIRLGTKITTLNLETMHSVDKALKIALALV